MCTLGAGEMIQHLRAFVFIALAQNLDSVPNIHIVTTTTPPIAKDYTPFSDLPGLLTACTIHKLIQRNLYINKTNKNKIQLYIQNLLFFLSHNTMF